MINPKPSDDFLRMLRFKNKGKLDESGFVIDTNFSTPQLQQRTKPGQLGITISTIEVNTYPLGTCHGHTQIIQKWYPNYHRYNPAK